VKTRDLFNYYYYYYKQIKSISHVGSFEKLLLSYSVDVGRVLLLEDNDRVAHLQCPRVHHLRDAEVPGRPVPRL